MKINTFKTLLICLLALSVLSSCRKNDEADILSYEIKNEMAEVSINGGNHSIEIVFPETFVSAGSLQSNFLLSDGATATVNGITQISGQTRNNYLIPFSYKVKSEDKDNTIEWLVTSTNNPYTVSWGLGYFLEHAFSSSRNYEWYIDQSNTGVHSGNNCGPASTTMAAKWSSVSFSKTTMDARAAYRPEGGWWYTNDIDKYLTDNAIPHYFINLGTTAAMTEQSLRSRLVEGYIIILCLDMYYIRKEADVRQRVDKFYTAGTTGWGHFIVVKGYRIVNSDLYFEVYDPYSFGVKYSDGEMKGRNRYYRSSDIFTATSKWWNNAIIIAQSGAKYAPDILAVEPPPPMWGR